MVQKYTKCVSPAASKQIISESNLMKIENKKNTHKDGSNMQGKKLDKIGYGVPTH